ncbi:MAG: preprotein translocase subunit YajC [Phycisphaerae bacterium]|nr:preprotein translocase subunit YajC [Phycisphaerae bacterium]
MRFDVDWGRQFYQNTQLTFIDYKQEQLLKGMELMRIWHVSVLLAAVMMLSVAQPVWAQTIKPAGETSADDAQELVDESSGKTDEKSEQKGEAATQDAKPPGGLFDNPQILIVMVAVMALLWWWMGRGRRKEQHRHKEMLSALKKGDKVTSIGGIIGTVIEVKDREVVVKVDESSNTRVKFLRSAIRNVGAGKDEDTGEGYAKS